VTSTRPSISSAFFRTSSTDAALGVGPQPFEAALAAAAGVDLRLDHEDRPAQLLGGLHRLFHAEGRMAARDRDAELREDGFGLVFVDVHEALGDLPRGSPGGE
jgi:hypothetical protein